MTHGNSINLRQYAQVALVVLLAVSCSLVLAPFLPAILLSVVVAVSTWPIQRWLLQKLPRRPAFASALTCLLVTLIVLVPIGLLMMSFGDGVSWTLKLLGEWQTSGPPRLPEWILKIPLIGEPIDAWWHHASADDDWLEQLAGSFAEPARALALASGRALADGLLQVAVAVVLLFFLYREGVSIVRNTDALVQKIGGTYGRELLMQARSVVVGVMFSVVGAGLAQATLATLGFFIAGVPNPFLLGALTFALSLVPVGPPLIWGGAAIWLYRQAEPGWALFMLLYGLLCISSIDNLLKPLLISRSSRLPFALTLIGVIGGILAFGVIGIFLGPMLLALSINLLSHWLATRERASGDEGSQ